jgi:hypothetical protein
LVSASTVVDALWIKFIRPNREFRTLIGRSGEPILWGRGKSAKPKGTIDVDRPFLAFCCASIDRRPPAKGQSILRHNSNNKLRPRLNANDASLACARSIDADARSQTLDACASCVASTV